MNRASAERRRDRKYEVRHNEKHPDLEIRLFANGPSGSGYMTMATKLAVVSKPRVLRGFENPVVHEEVPMPSLRTAALCGSLIDKHS